MSKGGIRVMHVTDALDAGGAERMAVNIVNLLPRGPFMPFLCTTRRDGALDGLVAGDVRRLRLRRTQRFDLAAIQRFVAYIREHRIDILHAHGPSLFIASVASVFSPGVTVLWHDHFGRSATAERPVWLYRSATTAVSGVLAVNQPLAEWSRRKLRVREDRVWYVPNFVTTEAGSGAPVALPGVRGFRIACVANVRPQKDHLTLIAAMETVAAQVPEAHLVIVGALSDERCVAAVQAAIEARGLQQHVSVLGPRTDVPDVLASCDIGVLSSSSEGLPLALIEYGAASLAAVATNVGQCGEVLDGGRAGLLVPPSSSSELAAALVTLLRSTELRRALAARLSARVAERYSPAPALEQICEIYRTVVGRQAAAA
jgi:glycosyltransferase involved in cell wall biosynthesis